MLRAGDAGRCRSGGKGDGEGAFIGPGVPVLELCRWWCVTVGCLSSPAELAVGVACGVEAAEFALATEIGVGVCFVLAGGW